MSVIDGEPPDLCGGGGSRSSTLTPKVLLRFPAGFQLRLEELLEARRSGAAEEPDRVSRPHRHPRGADRRRLRVHVCGTGRSVIGEFTQGQLSGSFSLVLRRPWRLKPR